VALLLAVAGAAWLVVAIATYLDAKDHTGTLLDAQLVEYGEVLGAIAQHDALEIAPRATTHDARFQQGATYQVYSLAGDLLLRSHDAPNAPLAASEGFSDVRAAGVEWRAYRTIDADNELVVIVAQRSAERDAIVRDLALRLVVPVLIALPLLALAIWLAVTRGLRPLQQLAAEVHERNAGRLDPLPESAAPVEVAPLVAEMNELFGRLGRSFQAERRLTGDAAHELRTPLAALRTHAEVALTTPSEDRRRRSLQQVVEGVGRAARSVEQMLMLARIDADRALEHLQPVELEPICREAVSQARAASTERGVTVDVDALPSLSVRGDRAMMLGLVRNLVDNALRFAPDAGRVRVSARREGADAVIAVEDSGPGVPEESRERIFDRFHRGDDPRGEGSGLGLSIVRRIAELHGGRATAMRSEALGGLRVEVRLPAMP
jgi:two-component system sensor histidine kinase QseC